MTESLNLSLEREERVVSETYRQYQDYLQRILLQQVQDGRYDRVITCAGKTIVEIQNELRLILRDEGVSVDLLCDHIERVYAFGGMSESGKSTAADYLRTTYGVTRLKIYYLIDNAAKINGLPDIYSQPDEALAELMLEELSRMARWQYYLQEYSLESLHRFSMTKHLKKLLGDSFVVCYCEASEQMRIERAADKAGVREKDRIKVERGADQIKRIADYILDNNLDFVSLRKQLDGVYANCSTQEFIPVIRDLNKLKMPINLRAISHKMLGALKEKLGNRLRLFAIVGSAGLQKAKDHWSDLDVLIITAPESIGLVYHALGAIIEASSVKLGVTILTQGEVRSLMVDSKVVHYLSLLRDEDIGVQYLGQGYKLPDINAQRDINNSFDHLPIVLHALRREIVAQKVDAKRLYKFLILCGKILLRTNYTNLESEDDIINSLAELYPDTTRLGIPLIEDILEGGVTEEVMRSIACGFLSWFETLLNQESSCRTVGSQQHENIPTWSSSTN